MGGDGVASFQHKMHGVLIISILKVILKPIIEYAFDFKKDEGEPLPRKILYFWETPNMRKATAWG